MTALLSQFFDVSKVLSHQRAQLNQDLSQFIGIPRGCSSFTQFPGLILRVHDDSSSRSTTSSSRIRRSRRLARLSYASSAARVQPPKTASRLDSIWKLCSSLISAINIARFESDAIAGLLWEPIHQMTVAFGSAAG